jgi:chorismate mutase
MNQKTLSDSDLETARQEIDAIDSQITELLKLRSEWVQQIAIYKCQNKISIYDASRENKILDKITQQNPSLYQAVDMANIFHAIMRAGLNQQLLYRSEHE